MRIALFVTCFNDSLFPTAMLADKMSHVPASGAEVLCAADNCCLCTSEAA